MEDVKGTISDSLKAQIKLYGEGLQNLYDAVETGFDELEQSMTFHEDRPPMKTFE